MMRNKDYFKEMGLDPANLGKSLDAASDRILCSIVFQRKKPYSALNPVR